MSTANEPLYRVQVGELDITPTLNARLVSITVTDCRGTEADTVEITLDDSDHALQLPRRGVSVRVALGWPDSGLVDLGRYTVDEVGHSGPPDQLTIRARAANLRDSLTTQRDQSWHETTLGAVLREIASRNQLLPAIGEALAAISLDHLDQTNESDINLITRLGQEYDAVATVKDARLVFAPAAAGTTVSGHDLPTFTIRRSDGDQHTLTDVDRGAYQAVRAWYTDVRSNKRQAVTVGRDADSAAPSAVKTLRHTYSTRDHAQRAADAELSRLQRETATVEITLARGRPELGSETPARLFGYPADMDRRKWVVTKSTHTLSDGGFVTRIEAEQRGE